MTERAILFFDTETTGLPDFRSRSTDPRQPHIVRLAAILANSETRAELTAVDMIIKPDGWTIPPNMTAIHGISQERALESPRSEDDAAAQYLILRGRADEAVGHNIPFDQRIMRIALLRLGLTREKIEKLEARPSSCTMQRASAIMKLPPTEKMIAAGFDKPKPPKLAECMQHFFNDPHDAAHDAMADVRACMRLYFHLIDTQKAAA